MFDIKNKQVAHIVAQIRAKQQATKYSQDKVQQSIIIYCDDHPDISDRELSHIVNENLTTFKYMTKSLNEFLKSKSLDDIGYPINTNKTFLQLSMSEEWSASQEEVITQIKNGRFDHNLTNTVTSNELPVLQSPSNQIYWGNENSSVSSVLLAVAAATCHKMPDSMPGTAAHFPFLNSSYVLPDDLIPSSYPFATKRNIMLFGDYQYGAHRYFTEQLLFGPEDCSSAVGKATYLTTKQIKQFNTTVMKDAYFNSNNEYHYKAVTNLQGNVTPEQLRLIQPGDIYLVKGHTAIITTVPDNQGNITTLQFNRDIDTAQNKTSGGGIYNYNLYDRVKQYDIYILRPSLEHLHETCSLSELLAKIDAKYFELFFKGPTDMPGDCRIFF